MMSEYLLCRAHGLVRISYTPVALIAYLLYRLVVRGEGHLASHNLARFGLAQRCARDLLEIPAPNDGEPEIVYSDWECRPFPMSIRDHCEQGNRRFCVSWATASYIYEVNCASLSNSRSGVSNINLKQIGLGFNVIALLAIAFGVSTHSRRRRIWKAVAGLVGLAGTRQQLLLASQTSHQMRSTLPNDRIRDYIRTLPHGEVLGVCSC